MYTPQEKKKTEFKQTDSTITLQNDFKNSNNPIQNKVPEEQEKEKFNRIHLKKLKSYLKTSPKPELDIINEKIYKNSKPLTTYQEFHLREQIKNQLLKDIKDQCNIYLNLFENDSKLILEDEIPFFVNVDDLEYICVENDSQYELLSLKPLQDLIPNYPEIKYTQISEDLITKDFNRLSIQDKDSLLIWTTCRMNELENELKLKRMILTKADGLEIRINSFVENLDYILDKAGGIYSFFSFFLGLTFYKIVKDQLSDLKSLKSNAKSLENALRDLKANPLDDDNGWKS